VKDAKENPKPSKDYLQKQLNLEKDIADVTFENICELNEKIPDLSLIPAKGPFVLNYSDLSSTAYKKTAK
jgi:hypothetical protein